MTSTTSPLIEEFATLLQSVFSLPDRPFAQNGVFAIDFEGKYGLRFEANTQLGEIVVYSDLTRQPPIEEVAELLLKANAFGRGTCGGFFAYDESAKKILLEKHLYAPFPNRDTFISMLDNFLYCLKTWEERLDNYSPPNVAMNSSNNGESIQKMMRV